MSSRTRPFTALRSSPLPLPLSATVQEVTTVRLLVTGAAGFIGSNFVHQTVRERGLAAGIGEGVQHRDLHVWARADRLVHEIRADESGCAGDEQTHEVAS